MPFLLHERFSETARKAPQKTALQLRLSADKYKRYTYSEALELSRSLGFYFINQGVKKQDTIALALENGPHWPLFYFGTLFAGAAVVPIDVQLPENEIKNIVSDSRARIVINNSNAGEILKGLEAPPRDFNFPRPDIEDTASLIYTSGTTAVPKGVVLTHKNFSENLKSIEQLKIYSSDDTVLSILPLHHSYPFMTTLLLPLCLGATITYVKSLKPDEILASMRETGVTMLLGVPQLYYLFHKGIFEKINKIPSPARFLMRPFISANIRRAFGPRLRFLASGGARLDPKVAKDLAGLGFRVIEGYGLTETSPIAAFNPLKKQKFGSVGKAIPNVEIRIANPDQSGTGEILIKGLNVMKGYYKRPEETAEAITDGWFHSGDLGRIDKEGYVFITGRQKEIIVLSNGKNIYPEEIEAHYLKTPFIKEMCVLGIVKKGATEELDAVIIPNVEHFKRVGEMNLSEKIRWELEALSKELPSYKRIMGFMVVKDELPRTRLGKIKRYQVEKKYGPQLETSAPYSAGEDAGLRGDGAEDAGILDSEIGKKVVEFIRGDKGIRGAIRANDHLELDLGIDSLGRVELAVALEKIFGIKIPDEAMAEIFTIKDVISRIEAIIARGDTGQEVAPAAKEQETWKTVLYKDPKDSIKGIIDLSPGISSKLVALIITGFAKLIFGLFFSLRIKGAENIPKKGPFIFCANHVSYLDGFIIAAGVPFNCEINLFFLGFRAYFEGPIIRDLVRMMRVIPIDLGVELINAMQASGFIIRNKKILCIFPEGQRSIDGEIKRFKAGIGILAKELDVPLVPVYLDGAFECWPRGRIFPRPRPVKVIFGKPRDHKYLGQLGREKGAKDDYEAIALGIKEEVMRLKPV